MNSSPHQNLLQDLRADRLAVRRRHQQYKRFLLATTLPIAFLGFVLFRNHPPQPASQMSEKTIPKLASVPVEEEPKLIDLLADAGPIIITLPDGSRILHLTNN